jgi:hypothetical protein
LLRQHIAYVRWSGSCQAVLGPSALCSAAFGRALNYSVDEDDLVLREQTIDQLGSMRAIRAYLDTGLQRHGVAAALEE